MSSGDAAAEELLQLYEQLQGQAPADAPPALKELFDDISKSQQAALKDKLDDQGTQTIYPTPGFVVKTVDNSGQKVFINVCSSDMISPPSSWENGVMPDSVRKALHKLDEIKSEEDVQAMRVPLSLSDQRGETDKNGNSCAVFDCVFAEQVMKEAAHFRPMKVFIIECCLGWIQHKCKVQLDPKFKLPKLRYKGDTIHEHRIRKESKKLVTEIEEVVEEEQPSLPLLTRKSAKSMSKVVSDNGTGAECKKCSSEPHADVSNSPVPVSHAHEDQGAEPIGVPWLHRICHRSLHQAAAGDLQHPTAQLIDVKYEGSPCQRVHINVKVKVHASQGASKTVIRVDVQCVHICPEEGPPVAIPLNVYVRPDTCQCNLQGEMLNVVLDYMCVDGVIQAAKDQKPLELGTVDLKSRGLLHELD